MVDDVELTVTPEMTRAAQDVISSLEAAFNSHDPVAVSEHFAEEAAWATVVGKELAGRAERDRPEGRRLEDRGRSDHVRRRLGLIGRIPGADRRFGGTEGGRPTMSHHG